MEYVLLLHIISMVIYVDAICLDPLSKYTELSLGAHRRSHHFLCHPLPSAQAPSLPTSHHRLVCDSTASEVLQITSFLSRSHSHKQDWTNLLDMTFHSAPTSAYRNPFGRGEHVRESLLLLPCLQGSESERVR